MISIRREYDVRKKNDFSGDEYKIKEKMSEIFRDMAEEEDIPEPDLSFLDDKGSSGKTEMDPRIKRRRRRERLKNFRRTATVFCAICGVFLLSSGIAVMISNQEAYAGNPVIEIIDRFAGYIKLQRSGKEEYDFIDENYQNIDITDESDLLAVKKTFPILLIPESKPEKYIFQNLNINIYGNNMFTYTYTYKNFSDIDDILRIDVVKRTDNSRITIFNDAGYKTLNNTKNKLYYQNDFSTGGVTGIYIMEENIVTISGILSENEVISIAESLK